MVKEAAKYYLGDDLDVLFGCCLDSSKAYDRVSHPLLFIKLLQRGVPQFLVNFLRH